VLSSECNQQHPAASKTASGPRVGGPKGVSPMRVAQRLLCPALIGMALSAAVSAMPGAQT
jgi:hypothetical protein